MKIKEIILLPSVIDKLIWKHHVSEQEVREALRNKPRFRRIEKGKVQNEDLYSALCKSHQGRYLIIFFIYKKTHDALVISARDMNDHERKKYEKK
ncbi:MAG: BrnT family toxin [candidate division KSB1 bacterium]|nr:BrnT family toxin [candidate division KSB1 bacterium]MDZ7341393.1 BrnT family toxin [candidate division KSB1 bacterium]